MSPRLPAAISKPIPRPPTTRSSGAGELFSRQIDELPSAEVLAEIDRLVNIEHLEATLMSEGIKKFTEPQKALLALVAHKRQALAAAH